jgi:GntR family transcriptional repressor for pyruvate dehydrogenase complex
MVCYICMENVTYMNRPKTLKLRPIEESLTQVDKIEIRLQEYFRTENFLPGDPIPKEIELASVMGVSRTAVREAIARFKTLGIIESRKNRGMIITRPDLFNNMERVLDSKLLSGDIMKEIFEMRLVLEMGIGDIIFLKKTDETLIKLEGIVQKEEKTIDKIERLKYDIEFHSMLYEISGNTTIQRFQKMLIPIFNYVDNGLHANRQLDNEAFVSHRVLLNILKNGTSEEYRNKMRSHLSQYFDKINEI